MSWLQGLGAAGQGLTAGLKDLREMEEAEQIKKLRQSQIDQLNRQATFQKELSEAANYDPYAERQTQADGARAQRILDTGEEIAPVQVRRSPLDEVRKYNKLQEIAMRNGQVETALRFGKEGRELHDRAVTDAARRAYTGLASGNVDALHDAYDNFFNDGFQMRGGIDYVQVPATDLYGRPAIGQDGKPQMRQVAVYNGERFDPVSGKTIEKIENVPLASLQQTVLGMTTPTGLMDLYKINTAQSSAQDKLLNAFLMKMMGEQGATDRTLIRGGGAGGSGSGSGGGNKSDALYNTVKDMVPNDVGNRAAILGNARSIINNNPGIPVNEGRIVDIASRVADGKLQPQVYVDGSGRMNYGVQYQGDYFKLRDGFDFEKMSRSTDTTADAGLNMRKQAQTAITNYFTNSPNAIELVNELATKDLKSLSKEERTALTGRFRAQGWGSDLGMIQQAARDAKKQLDAAAEPERRGVENNPANRVDPESRAGQWQARRDAGVKERAEKSAQLQARAIEAIRGDDLSAVDAIQQDPLFSTLPNDIKVQVFNRMRGTGGYRGIRP